MIQNSSSFSVEEENIAKKDDKNILFSNSYENVTFSNKALKPCGEVEVIKDFHIEIKSGNDYSFLEYKVGDVLDLTKSFFKKKIYLGNSPSGFYILSDIDYNFFKVLD